MIWASKKRDNASFGLNEYLALKTKTEPKPLDVNMSPREKRDVVLKVFLRKNIPDWAHKELDKKFKN
tara:strand:- start:332 stop:532 length:201 start_codon:yes stop_codon:yes gene_type:complete